MIQRHVPHEPGTFATCNGCRREPRHITSAGISSREPCVTRAIAVRDRHALECCRCGRSTARHATLDDAIAEWGAAYAQASLPLRIVPARRRAAG